MVADLSSEIQKDMVGAIGFELEPICGRELWNPLRKKYENRA